MPANLSTVLGAFRTPSLRCVNMRPSFTHTGQYRALDDLVLFFDRGGPVGYLGSSENVARNLTPEERAALVAFLRALDGDGPAPDLVTTARCPPMRRRSGCLHSSRLPPLLGVPQGAASSCSIILPRPTR